MSDYVRNKVLRIPFNKYFPDKNIWDFEAEHLEIFNPCYNKKEYFEIPITENNRYIDYVLNHNYGQDCGDFGHTRLLTATEKEIYTDVFKAIIPNIDMDDVHYVDYCYYNCCEAPDYYEIEEVKEEGYSWLKAKVIK